MHKFSQAYRDGLRDLLSRGSLVPSVVGAKSKASNFGAGNRPWLELRAYEFSFDNPTPLLPHTPALPMHVPYLLGLLAWTLDGRDDVASLSYYRESALDFSDDGATMCGAFGARLFGGSSYGNQIGAILERLRTDPSSRRTFASIILPSDNTLETREFPCAAGIQLFVRDGRLHWLTVMRAEQALTILPYDVCLFSWLHHFVAATLGVLPGFYHHFSGTFHIYENERQLAESVIDSEITVESLPTIPSGAGREVTHELIGIERNIREAAINSDTGVLDQLNTEPSGSHFCQSTKEVLLQFAKSKLQISG
jgi:thymidylate synthase